MQLFAELQNLFLKYLAILRQKFLLDRTKQIEYKQDMPERQITDQTKAS